MQLPGQPLPVEADQRERGRRWGVKVSRVAGGVHRAVDRGARGQDPGQLSLGGVPGRGDREASLSHARVRGQHARAARVGDDAEPGCPPGPAGGRLRQGPAARCRSARAIEAYEDEEEVARQRYGRRSEHRWVKLTACSAS